MDEIEDVIKMVIVANHGTEPKMRGGKLGAQVAHAALAGITSRLRPARHFGAKGTAVPPGAMIGIFSVAEIAWITGSFRKIVLRAESADELRALYEEAREAGLEAHLITDAGHTEFREPTVTALAIGPDYASKIDQITGHLRPY